MDRKLRRLLVNSGTYWRELHVSVTGTFLNNSVVSIEPVTGSLHRRSLLVQRF